MMSNFANMAVPFCGNCVSVPCIISCLFCPKQLNLLRSNSPSVLNSPNAEIREKHLFANLIFGESILGSCFSLSFVPYFLKNNAMIASRQSSANPHKIVIDPIDLRKSSHSGLDFIIHFLSQHCLYGSLQTPTVLSA